MIIFNRADTSLKVLEAVRKVRPRRLYIAADGPRVDVPDDLESCKQTREIVDNIDWECELKTLFRDENVGCGHGPADAITWFFSQEEQGIILEDDCVPDPSFFYTCENLLQKYANDTRIMHIGGFNLQFGQTYGNASYYFSKYPEVWGWASWRRAWDLFDFSMSDFQQFKTDNQIANIFPNVRLQEAWLKALEYTYQQPRPSIWDYRWMYTIWKNHGLCITPNKSLVKNIGFDGRGTHTNQNSEVQRAFAAVEAEAMGELVHPKFVIPCQAADLHTQKMRILPPLKTMVRRKVTHELKKIFNFE